MNLPCSVTRDLLPLYAEKMVEQETEKLVEEHLASCVECRQKLSEIEAGTTPSVDTSKPLNALKKEIRNRRWRAALIAALCVFVLVFTYFYHETDMKPVPWEDGLVEVQGIETRPYEDVFEDADSSETHDPTVDVLLVHIDSRVNGLQTTTFVDDDGTRTELLRGWSSNPDNRKAVRDYTESISYPVPDRLIYSDGSQQKLLWGEPLNGGVEVLPRLALTYYLLIAATLAGLFGLLWFIFRNKTFSWIVRQLFFAPVSYLFAHFLLKGTHTASFFMERDFVSILLVTAAIYGILSLAWQMWLQRRKES